MLAAAVVLVASSPDKARSAVVQGALPLVAVVLLAIGLGLGVADLGAAEHVDLVAAQIAWPVHRLVGGLDQVVDEECGSRDSGVG